MMQAMGYHVVRAGEHSFEERPNPDRPRDQPARLASDLTTAASLGQSRARLWRYPPGTRGRRHADEVQEEVFVVLSGTLTMLLGEPPERVELPPQSVVAVEPKTPAPTPQRRRRGGRRLRLRRPADPGRAPSSSTTPSPSSRCWASTGPGRARASRGSRAGPRSDLLEQTPHFGSLFRRHLLHRSPPEGDRSATRLLASMRISMLMMPATTSSSSGSGCSPTVTS